MGKIKFTNLVASIWKHANVQKPMFLDPEGNGWKIESGRYMVQWFEGDQIPKNISTRIDENALATSEVSSDEEVDYESDSDDDL